jgi:FkbM family methyltransferase
MSTTLTPTAASTKQQPQPAAAAEPDSWAVATASGSVLRLPPSMRSLTTYVLLEQERWFEPEMSLLPLLLQPGDNALDIGANHGLYTLEIARCSGNGRVWAFEPTSVPRGRLQMSVTQAALASRVVVVDAALADSDGQASFAVHDNSEMNSREGTGTRRERVRLTTLDGYLQAHAPDAQIAFVKLDAEGDELRVLAGGRRFFETQSPVVLFEYKHGRLVNNALLQAWAGLGFELFRWSAELSLLLPFDLATAEAAFALNLVAVRPATQAALAARGLLVLPQDWTRLLVQVAAGALPPADPAQTATALQAWCRQPAVRGHGDPAAQGTAATPAAANDVYANALGQVALAHAGSGVDAAVRAAALLAARHSVSALVAGGASQGVETWVLLVHCLHALGEQHAAVQLGQRVLAQWPASGGRVSQPLVPPRVSDLQRQRSTAAGPWLKQVLGEFVATNNAYSSYFETPAPERWAALLDHPDHDAGIERRYLLSHVLCDRVAAVDKLRLLAASPDGCNAFLWQGLIRAMASMAPEAAPQAASLPSAAEVLAALPVAAVQVVDVGASSLGQETEPYAPLLRAGRASVVGFEPDAAALQELQRRAGTQAGQRYLPHFVGNGQPGVFHAMQWSLTSSLLPPNRAQLDRYHQLGNLVLEAGRHAVQTVRLDDVIAPGGMDLLKIDVQGGELQVFDGAAQRLAECLVVWTEVEMLPLYSGQPLFADIDARLRQHGLQFLCFTGLATRALASWPAGASGSAPAPRRQQQLWADAIYVPHPDRIAQLSADAAARLALIAHHVVDACDLCHAALLRYDALCGTRVAADYLAAVRGAG